MSPRKASDLVAVTNQYPKKTLDALNELVAYTHIPKAHHLREALRTYLEAHGRLARPMWDFIGNQAAVVISSKNDRQTASLPEMYALIELGDHLFPTRLDVYLDSDSGWKRGTERAESFIVLGGPRQNRVAVELLDAWKDTIPFEMKSRGASSGGSYELRNCDTGEKWLPDTTRGDRVANDFADFGLVVKAPGPQGAGTSLLFAGCHAFGTHAAVRALTDERSVSVLTRLLPAAEAHFAAVVQVRVRNFSPEPPAIADLFVFPNQDLAE